MFMTAMLFFTGVMAQHSATTSLRQNTVSIVKPNIDPSARAIIFEDDFTGGTFADWTVMGEGAANWTESPTNNAGGTEPEAEMYYNPLFTGISLFVSPVINTTGHSQLLLSFLNNLDLWSGGGGFWIGVETTSDGGTTWNPVWEMEYTSTNNYTALETIAVATSDVGSANFQFCFYYMDNSDLLDWWNLDDIVLEEPSSSYDVSPTAILGIEGPFYGSSPVNASAKVVNYGTETVTFDVQFDIIEGSTTVFTDTKSVSGLAFGETGIVAFDEWTAYEGVFTARVTTLLSGDENPSNDIIEETINVFGATSYCTPSANCSWGDGFTDFAFAGIENYGSGCSPNGFGNYTALEANCEPLQTYKATFASGYSSNYASMWIDFDQDFTFEDWELVLADFELGDAGELVEVDITIPGYASGTTTMRIGANYSAPSSPDPCATFVYGEWEDYTINFSGTPISYDAIAVSINNPAIVGVGDITPLATVKNGGTETISFSVTCETDGYTSTVDVTDLTMGETIQLEFDTWAATAGEYELNVTTDLNGDEIPENDNVSKTIAVVSVVPEKKVVGEEGTGTWCGWCVRGIVYMDSMRMKYPDTWIGIGVHNGDPMVVPEYDAGVGPLIGNAYPGGLVDRGWYCDPSDFEAYYLERMQAIPPAHLNIENRMYDPGTRELSFTLTADFVVSASDYRLSAVLLEHEVTGTESGYNQANYYSGGGNGPMGGWENLPNPVPAEDMVYQDVARALLGDFNGIENSLPASINAGESHSWDFTVTLDESWEVEHMEIVGMLIDHANGTIENGTLADLLVGIPEEKDEASIQIYPNPARNTVSITHVENADVLVYNMEGQQVLAQERVSGTCTFNVSGLMNGTYIVKILNEDEIITRKVVIIR